MRSHPAVGPLIAVAIYCSLFWSIHCTVQDCVQGEWGTWSSCSRTCNGGLQKRTRATLQQPWSTTFNYTAGVCACDMVLMLDTSFSISSADWLLLLSFAKTMAGQMTGNKMGIVTFDKTVTAAQGLTSDVAALNAALDGIVRCDGYQRTDCYERHTYDAIPIAQQMFETEMAANPTRSACRVILTITHGSPSPANAVATTQNLNALNASHPDWGLMVAAVGPNAWLGDLQAYATSLNYIVEVPSYSSLVPSTAGVLSQCFFSSTSLRSPTCACDYIIGFDTTYTKFSGYTALDVLSGFVMIFVTKLIDATASVDNPNRFAFFAFGNDINISTTNPSLYPPTSSDLYFFPNTPDNVTKAAMYQISGTKINRATTATSALSKMPVCIQPSASCTTRKTFDGLENVTRIMELEPERSRSVCKTLILFMNSNHSNPHTTAAKAAIVNYIKYRHPEWNILILTLNATKNDKQNYWAVTNDPANVVSFDNLTSIRDTGASVVMSRCGGVADNPLIEYPVPCGPSEDHAICNTGACADQNCVLSDEVEIVPCSVTCGGGTRVISRMIVTEATGAGTPCDLANVTRIQACNIAVCGNCSYVLGASCPTNYVNKVGLDWGTPCQTTAECVGTCCDSTCASVFTGGICPTNYFTKSSVDFTTATCASQTSCLNRCCEPTCAQVLGSACPANDYMNNPAVDFAQTACMDTTSCVAACCLTTCLYVLANTGCPANYWSKGVDFATVACTDTTACTAACCDATCSALLPGGVCPAGYIQGPGVDYSTTRCATSSACLSTCCQPTCEGILAGGVCPTGSVTSTGVVLSSTVCTDQTTCFAACCTATCAGYTCVAGALKTNPISILCGPYGSCNDSLCCNPPVDCVGSFVASGPCTQACGGGQQTSYYTITVPMANNGKPCPYASQTTQTVACNTAPCEVTSTAKKCKDFNCPANLVVKENSRDLKCTGSTCTADQCCQAPTCLTVEQSMCGLLMKRVNNPGDVSCKKNPCTQAECCQSYFQNLPTITTDVDSCLDKLKDLVTKVVTATTVYKSDPAVVVQITVSQPPAPVTRDNGKTTAVIDDYGKNVVSAALSLVSQSAAPKLGISLPSDKTFSTDIVSIERRDSDNNLVKNASITFYLCSSDVTSSKLTVYRINSNTGKLENLLDLGGTVTLCTDCAATLTCRKWFKVQSPTTSSFIGEAAAPAVCGDGKVDWDNGEQCDPPNVGCCDANCRFKPKGLICRRPTSECDALETCNGVMAVCPQDHFQPDGMACNKAATTPTDRFVCKAGRCIRTRGSR